MNRLLLMLSSQLALLLANRLPPLAWFAIAVMVILFLVTNIILVAMLIAKKTSAKSMRPGQAPGFMSASKRLEKFGEVMRDPFAKERSQLNELSQRVRDLDQSPVDPSADEADRRGQKS